MSVGVIMNIEIKIYDLSSERINYFCNKLNYLLKNYNLNILLSSFNINVINYFYSEKKDFKLGFISDEIIKDTDILNKVDYIILNKKLIEYIKTLINSSVDILIYSVNNDNNDNEIINSFKKYKNIGYISDNVYKLIDILNN
jgi:hypothetical protein